LGALGVGGGAFLLGRPLQAFDGPLISAAIRPRRVGSLVKPVRAMVGEVFKVRRTFPVAALDQVDPFLLLDFFDFTLAPGELGGLAPHPHRGFETVTLLFDGAIEHGDSIGNRGRIESGDVQWMTAGSGIVHEENPDDSLRERGGRVLGIQLWVNLPKRLKMTPPTYQDTASPAIPVLTDKGVRARVIAGSAHGVTAVIGTHTPMALIDYTLQPGAEVSMPYPRAWTAFVHVVDGIATIGDTQIGPGQLAHLNTEGDGIHIHNETKRPVRLLLGGGQPINEPVARWGPFVMNTKDEIRAARADYRSGRMGRVANPTYDRIRRR